MQLIKIHPSDNVAVALEDIQKGAEVMGDGKNMLNNLTMTLDGIIHNVDICLINDKPFIYVATIGKFAEIPYETPRELKKKFGYLAYKLLIII